MDTVVFKQNHVQPLEKITYERPSSLCDVHTHYCPGCTHGTAHRLVAEVLDELDIREDTIRVLCGLLGFFV